MAKRILIIDDDRAVCSSLKLLLSKRGYMVEAIFQVSEVEDTVSSFQPDVILLDMNFSIETSGKQGLRTLDLILRVQKNANVVLMTGWATVQLAVEGMKKGAKDFVAKPWDNHSLVSTIETIIELSAPSSDVADKNTSHDNGIIGESPIIKSIVRQAQQIAKTDAPVLITGESGTGKELLAEMIHQHGKRQDNNFVKVNLGGISNTLFESEMFGHRKGAFTGAFADRMGRFEKADKGTIFLDEIGELDLSSQVKLLRVLQEKTFEQLGSSHSQKVDIRVISATNRDLPTMISQATFREDLFYRINLIHIYLPSLAERREDIPLLVEYFKNKVSQNYGLDPVTISNTAIEWLKYQDYPGNIRQLSNVVERVILMNIGLSHLDETRFKTHFSTVSLASDKLILPEVGQISLEELEKRMVIKALEHHQFSISKSARSLGITRSALYRRLEKFQIPYEGHL